jgi:hypothetical protein
MKRRIGAGFASLALAGTFVAGTAVSAFAQPLSNSEFKKQANAAAEQAFGSLPKGQEPSPEQFAAFAAVLIPNVAQQVEDVAALEAPKSLKAKVNKLIKTARATVAKVTANPSLLADEKHDPFAATNKQAKKLGLKECAGDEDS